MNENIRSCDCDLNFPDMQRIPAAGLTRFYLCVECGTVRAEHPIGNVANTTSDVTFHAYDDTSLPASVKERAAAILENRNRKQEPLL